MPGGVTGKAREGISMSISFPHKCMYDTSALLSVLRETGFTAASKKPFESDIEDIDRIESKERATNAVITEGYK